MPYLFDFFYLSFLVAVSPWLLYKAVTTGKYRRGLGNKFFGLVPTGLRQPCRGPCAWFHGVSVGEIKMLRTLVTCFRQRHPDWDCVISTTTDTGFEEASKLFPNLRIFYWPLDFTWAVRRTLRVIRPDVVILGECELWPNFLKSARDQGIPVVVVNGRMSPRSFRRWKLFKSPFLSFLRPIVRAMFDGIARWGVQNEEYASNLRGLGIARERVQVTGNIKFDGVVHDRENPKTQELRRLLDVRDDDLIWIVGSTQAPEEEIALDIHRRALAKFSGLRLFIVPRQRDRFGEVGSMLEKSDLPFIRRSELDSRSRDSGCSVVLVDTIGELGALWGLADVAFVGGSLDGRRGGQSMIEPAGYGAAVLFGFHVWNFRDTATGLVEAGAAVQVADAGQLELEVSRLLGDAAERQRLGEAARKFVLRQQGAAEKTVDLILSLVESSRHSHAA